VKLIGALVLSMMCAACMSHARPAQRIEAPDPVIGNLKCSQPRITILEALYYTPDASTACVEQPSS
jgi:hypothetical protein